MHWGYLLAIALVIVVIIFGVGRLGDVGGALGKSIREFRASSKEDPAPPAADSPRQP